MPVEQTAILQKLQKNITGETEIDNRTNKVRELIQEVDVNRFKTELSNLQDWIRVDKGKRELSSLLKEKFEDTAVAYLFTLNRKFIPEDKFDTGKEERQIKAVLSLLSGNHVHLGTGEGKSSVVFPIAALVEALSAKNKASILSTANETLLAELKTNTQRFLEELKKNGAVEKDFFLEGYQEPENPPHTELKETMIKEALLTGEYMPETKEKIKNAYWEDKLNPNKSRTDFLNKKSQTPTIMFLTERNLVFAFAENPKKFREKTPTIFMDEAHVPYDRASAYEQTQKSIYASPEDVHDSTFYWLLDYLTVGKLSKADFELKKGRLQIKEEAKDRLMSVDWKSLDVTDPRFRKAINIVTDNLHFSEAEKAWFATSSLAAFKRTVGYHDPQEIKEIVGTIDDTIAGPYNEGGSSWVFDSTSNTLKVRDEYLGKIIEGHEFLPEIQLLIRTLNDSFDFIPLRKRASSVMRYQTFINSLGEKVRCASGSLLFPNPKNQKIEQSPFAFFLEKVTKKNVVLISPPESKVPPPPEFFPRGEQAVEKLVTDARQIYDKKKPQLVVAWKEGEVETIYNKLAAEFGVDKVAFITSEPKPEEEKEIYRKLAKGEISFVVSSGASGLGVDIKKSDELGGGFPDLHVTLFNIPKTRLQLIQTVARRRLPGNDFSWYIDYAELENLTSYFDRQVPTIQKALGKYDIQKIEDEINSSTDNPDKRLDIILRLLEKSETARIQNDDYVVAFDSLMRKITESGENFVQNKLKTQGVNNTHLAWYALEYGLPASLNDDLAKTANLIMDAQSVRDLIETKLPKKIAVDKIDLSEWMDMQKRYVDELFSIVWGNGRVRNIDLIKFLVPNEELKNQFVLTGRIGSLEAGWGFIPIEGVRVLSFKDPTGNLFCAFTIQPDNKLAAYDFQKALGKQLQAIRTEQESHFLLFGLTPKP